MALASAKPLDPPVMTATFPASFPIFAPFGGDLTSTTRGRFPLRWTRTAQESKPFVRSSKQGGCIGPGNRCLPNVARNRFRSAQARSYSPVGLDRGETDRRKTYAFRQEHFTH